MNKKHQKNEKKFTAKLKAWAEKPSNLKLMQIMVAFALFVTLLLFLSQVAFASDLDLWGTPSLSSQVLLWVVFLFGSLIANLGLPVLVLGTAAAVVIVVCTNKDEQVQRGLYASAAAVFTIAAGFMIYSQYRSSQTLANYDKTEETISRDEFLAKLEACEVESFTAYKNYLRFSYVSDYDNTGKRVYRPQRAELEYYDEYAVKAESLKPKCVINYSDFRGSGETYTNDVINRIWISEDQAKAEMQKCTIKIIYYNSPEITEGYSVDGNHTGIQLIERQDGKQLGVEPGHESVIEYYEDTLDRTCGSIPYWNYQMSRE